MRKALTIALTLGVLAGIVGGALAAAHATQREARRAADLEAALEAARFSTEKARAEAAQSNADVTGIQATLERVRSARDRALKRVSARTAELRRARGRLSFLQGVQRDLSTARDRLLACEDALSGLRDRGARLGPGDDLKGMVNDAFNAGRARDRAALRDLRAQIGDLQERLSTSPVLDSVTRTSIDTCSRDR